MQIYSYKLQIRNRNWIQYAGRLYQQYIVDQYAKIEQNWLNYLRQNQSTLWTELYQSAIDAVYTRDNANNIGQYVILPSSFAGRSRQMYQLYQDAMAIINYFEKSDLFVTFTCNLKWPKITKELLSYQTSTNRSNLTAWVFYIKLQELLRDLCDKHLLEKVIAYIYVIEF